MGMPNYISQQSMIDHHRSHLASIAEEITLLIDKKVHLGPQGNAIL